MEKRDCQINVRIPCSLRDELEEQANKEQRRLSDMVVIALQAFLEKKKD
ncbi:MAG: hypothetical protein ABW116_08555 [Candidatus Sedimenticola sp. 20ELBAFRAG]